MDNTLLLVITLIAGGILWRAVYKDSPASSSYPQPRRQASKRQRAEILLSLMFAENEQARLNLKAAALESGLGITGKEDHIWRTGYLLMSAADRERFQMMAWMMIKGFPLPPDALAASDDLLAYLRSHGVRPGDISEEFWEARGFYVSRGDIRKRDLR